MTLDTRRNLVLPRLSSSDFHSSQDQVSPRESLLSTRERSAHELLDGAYMQQEKRHDRGKSFWRWRPKIAAPGWLKRTSPRHQSEQPKVVISKSRWRWLVVIFIHMIPILGATVIAAINLTGFFIGDEFVGVSDPKGQSIALLSLQVTAKLFELVVISSLGLIVLDTVQHFLLVDQAGLPLALAGARLSFTNLFYLFTPGFWSGIRSFQSRKARIFVTFLIVTCGLLATLVGPSAAVLLIPLNQDRWPAGGLRFRIPQDASQLWPSQLNYSHIGSTDCANPLEADVDDPTDDWSDCIWYSAAKIGSRAHDSWPGSGNLTTDEWESTRFVSFVWQDNYLNEDIYMALSPMAFTDLIGLALRYSWQNAVYGTANHTYIPFHEHFKPNFTWSPLSKYSRYGNRQAIDDRMEFHGLLGPVTRTYCSSNFGTFTDGEALLEYPVLGKTGLVFANTNTTYLIPTDLVSSTTVSRTTWIPKPKTLPEIRGEQPPAGENIEQLPSALLAVQWPRSPSTTEGWTLACSVDARWTKGSQVVVPNHEINADNSVTYLDLEDAMQSWEDDEDGPTLIDLDLSWLNQLTPSFPGPVIANSTNNTNAGYNSLSKVLNTIPDDLTDLGELQVVTGRLQTIVPFLVADGMARHNLADLYPGLNASDGGTLGSIYDDWLNENSTTSAFVLLPDGGGMNALPPPNASEPAGTEVVWNIFIVGYAYAANSTASILALAVLFLYIFLSLGHICFVVYKRWNSWIWWSVPDIITISQNSPPSALFKNTASGIDRNKTYGLLLRLRVPNKLENDGETIHLLVNGNKKSLGYRKLVGYRRLEKGEQYC